MSKIDEAKKLKIKRLCIETGAGNSPALRTFAISWASCASASPLIRVCPVGILSFIKGVLTGYALSVLF